MKIKILIFILILFLLTSLGANYFLYQKWQKELVNLVSEQKHSDNFARQKTEEIIALKQEVENWKNKFYQEEDLKDEWRDKYKENEKYFKQATEKLNGLFGTIESIVKVQKIDKELLSKYSKEYFLNEHYIPKNLISVESKYLYNKNKNLQMQGDVYEFFKEMVDDAKRDGINLKIISAYRSFTTQKYLKERNIAIYGKKNADAFVANQGLSEHQLGSTVDFVKWDTGKLANFEKSKEFEWLKENAYKYGFILSYPEKNKYYSFEPWHWRFVGRKLAKYLNRQEQYFNEVDQRKINEYLEYFFD